MRRFKETASYTPLGLRPNGRYAAEVRGLVYDHATDDEQESRVPTYISGRTQEEADKAADRFGQAWKMADSP